MWTQGCKTACVDLYAHVCICVRLYVRFTFVMCGGMSNIVVPRENIMIASHVLCLLDRFGTSNMESVITPIQTHGRKKAMNSTDPDSPPNIASVTNNSKYF